MTMIVSVTCKQCGEECDVSGCRSCIVASYPPLGGSLNRDDVTKRIKAALVRRSGKQWSVTAGRGTASGWLRISAPKARLGCARLHDFDWQTNECSACGSLRFGPREEGDPWACSGHVCSDQCYGGYIVPEDREELARLLDLTDVRMQGVQIAHSNGHYIEYIDRAEGRLPRTFGQRYWD